VLSLWANQYRLHRPCHSPTIQSPGEERFCPKCQDSQNGNGIQNFYIQSVKGQGLVYGGLAFFYAGILATDMTNEEAYLILTLAGGVFAIWGTVLEIDSYKFLNIKSKSGIVKPKPKEAFTYEW